MPDIFDEARDVVNQMELTEKLGFYKDGVYELTGNIAVEPGHGGDGGGDQDGGHGGDIIIRVRPGCALHIHDLTVTPGTYGQDEALPGAGKGGRPGRLIIEWDVEG